MESMVKKYQQRFRKIKEEMGKWDTLQSTLLSQFRNASSIIDWFQVIRDSKNYGTLIGVDGIVNAVLRKQMESLQNILLSMNKSLYLLKKSVVSALPYVIFKLSLGDLAVLQQLLVDQPNVPKEEVQFIFDIIFAEEIY